MMKFCKDCAHSKPDWAPHCHREGYGLDPVTGEQVWRTLYSPDERGPLSLWERLFGTKRCGPDARFWTAKGSE